MNCTAACDSTARPATAERAPRLDAVETETEFTLRFDLPGVAPADVDLVCEDRVLTLHAPLAARATEGQRLAEFGTAPYRRAFRLDDRVDATRIEARCEAGVLTVRLPKTAVEPVRRIAVTPG